ncbi:gp623 [Bacillus phage G]|uniref:Gp623 n=1 Tax=Bacillus phage G TaxID=2884420 RepID=G3MB03_9CAUD|nr:gp623 [Bacillus phage G]AEO93868.1 gp623 [Bacillus phage G]
MELNEKEKMLIEAVREMGEVPVNVLLWYVAGLEEAVKTEVAIHGKEVRGNSRNIEIARSYMRSM